MGNKMISNQRSPVVRPLLYIFNTNINFSIKRTNKITYDINYYLINSISFYLQCRHSCKHLQFLRVKGGKCSIFKTFLNYFITPAFTPARKPVVQAD